MDMKLNRKTIKQRRLAKAWSQAELAAMTNLSLRTIQRIEKQGQASLESARSLAAVFEVSVGELAMRPSPFLKLWPMPLITAIVMGVVIMLPAAAENIMLNVVLREQGTMLADVQMLNQEDEESEIRIDDQRKLTFLSQVSDDGLIHIAVKVYERQGQTMNLVAEPAIMTENQRPAVIKLGDLSITLEPSL